MSKVTKTGFSDFRRRFEPLHKPRVPTGSEKNGHIYAHIQYLESSPFPDHHSHFV